MAASAVAPITSHQTFPTHLHTSRVNSKPNTSPIQISTYSSTPLSLDSSLLKNQTTPSTSKTQQAHFNYSFQTFLHESSDSASYASVIESCNCLHLGKQIHAHSFKRGFCGSHEFLETKLLVMYGRCGSVELACFLFEKMLCRNIYSWAGILTVCVDHGYFEKALFLFQMLQVEGIVLEFFIFPVVLKACGGLGALDLGRELHGLVVKFGFVSNLYVGNALIDLYGKCGDLDEAIKVLKEMPEVDCVSWNSVITACATNGMVFEALDFLEHTRLSSNVKPNLVSWSAVIGGFSQNGYDEEALELLHRMQESNIKPNARTLASVLPACARLQTINIGKEIHGYIMRHELMSNSFVINGLIDVYRRCGDMGRAQMLFLRFSVRNLVSYNTMIVGYCENNDLIMAKELFDHMELDGVTRDTISWNSMISGYADNEKFEEALKMFRNMQIEEGLEADSFTLGSTLTACAAMAAIRLGKEIHTYAISRGLHSNPFVGGALVEMYCRCQDLEAAQLAFDEIVERDTVTWNVLISGYARSNQVNRSLELLSLIKKDGLEPNTFTWNGIIAGYMENGHNEQALKMLLEMQTERLKPDIFTVGMVLPICSRLISIERGKQVHAFSVRCGYDMDVHIGAALVDLYAKCGILRYARLAFHRISHQNLVSYNTMLAGFAMHGLGKEGIALFDKMLVDGVRPDEITFLSVLSSCVHVGSIEDGRQYFNLMKNYEIKPELKHYTCMVDCFSRNGQLNEAHELIQKMPMKPDAVVWGALLGGCVIHNNVELGEIAANRLIELEEDNTGNYVLLANLYAAAGRTGDFARTRQIIRERRMHKSPGCSWIEDRDQIHVFLANDRSHKQTDEIYATVEKLNLHMRKQGDKAWIA